MTECVIAACRECADSAVLRAQRSNPASNDKAGLLPRLAPSANASRLSQAMTDCVIADAANALTQPSLRVQRSNPALNHKAGLLRRVAPSANAARLSQAMTEWRGGGFSVFAQKRTTPLLGNWGVVPPPPFPPPHPPPPLHFLD